MQILSNFCPGDGTRYRVAIHKLTPEEGKENNVGSTNPFYFAFGIGNNPMVGYFFNTAQTPSLEYVSEKFWNVDRHREWTFVVITACLNYIVGNTELRYLPSDKVTLLEEKLDFEWAVPVIEAAQKEGLCDILVSP